MGNLVSIMTHCRTGDAVIMEENAHCYHNETGNIASLAGVLPRPLTGTRGVLSPEDIANSIRGDDVLHSRTRLICIENTHNVSGGTIWKLDQLKAVVDLAKGHHLKVHVDGARIFNAAIGLDVEPARLAEGADSLTFCLTKGLSCPYGSLIVGDREFISEAKRYRQMTGGGMRQAGIMAAAGVVALESMINRLSEDHAHARQLASGLRELGLDVDLEAVQTNMVYARLPNSSAVKPKNFTSRLAERDIWINDSSTGRFRFVTHSGISQENIQTTLNVIEHLVNN